MNQPIGSEVNRDLEKVKADRPALESGAQRVDPSVAFQVGQDRTGALVSEEVCQIISRLRGVSQDGQASLADYEHTLEA